MDRSRTKVVAVAIAAVLVLVTTACQDWTQFGGDPALNGNDSGETTIKASNLAQLTQQFTIAMPAGSVPATPVISNGLVYDGTSTGELVAAPNSSGAPGCAGSPIVCQPLWTASLPGDDIANVPTVVGGVVYDTFYSDARPTGALAAFDASGTTGCSGTPKVCQPLWTASVVSTASPNVDDGTVFVADVTTASLLAFDAGGVTDCSGTPTVCQPEWSGASPSIYEPSVADGRVYVSRVEPDPATGATTGVDVYDEAGMTGCTGSPKVCQPEFSVPGNPVSPVAVSGTTGYVVEKTSADTTVDAFDATGVSGCTGTPTVCQPEWSAFTVSDGYSNDGPPTVAAGRVYVNGDGIASAYDATSATCGGTPPSCLQFFTSGSTRIVRSSLVTNGLLIDGNQIYDATGATNCTGSPVPTCTPLLTLPVTVTEPSTAVVADTDVWAPGTDGSIHVFGLGS